VEVSLITDLRAKVLSNASYLAALPEPELGKSPNTRDARLVEVSLILLPIGVGHLWCWETYPVRVQGEPPDTRQR
jgi:hypothetical protein